MIRPSYRQGFATHQLSKVPHIWKDVVFASAPFLGITGGNLFDWGGLKINGTNTDITWVNENGWGLDTDGVTGFVDLGPRLTPLINGKSFTILMLLKPRTYAGIYRRAVEIGDGVLSAGLAWPTAFGQLSFHKPGTGEVFTDAVIAGDILQQWVLSQHGTNMNVTDSRIYVDGDQKATTLAGAGGAMTYTGDTIFAKRSFNNVFLPCTYYQMIIWARALSSNVINWLYRNPLAMWQELFDLALFGISLGNVGALLNAGLLYGKVQRRLLT